MLNNQTILEQFRSFYKEHNPKNFEDAVEKFAIFGGVGWGELDTSKDSFELIQKLVLPDYRYIRNDVSELSTGMPLYHSILTGIAVGDGKTHTAYKRANISKEVGDKAIEELCDLGIIKLDKSKKVFTSWAEEDGEKVSNKLYFTSPFLRFWFAFISPLFKGIKEGDYKEVREKFQNRKSEFTNLIFEQLSQEVLKTSFKDDKIVECSSYWDNEIELEIYAKTKSGKIIAGSCKYTNSKIKKSELTKLQEKCKKAKIKADIFVIFSKQGFSSELKSLKGENIKLYTIKNFKLLVENE
ncbi:MAG: ATPase [Sulfurimonas sp.]|nr:ATPase [Sulfurimonas sp.]